MYTLKGKVHKIGEIQQVSDSFKKREIVIQDDSGKYPQTISFQATQDRCDILSSVREGDGVEVTFFLRGREWTSPKDGQIKYFNSLDIWKIELEGNNIEESKPETFVNEGDDDLPF